MTEICQNCRKEINEYYDKANYLCVECSIDADEDRLKWEKRHFKIVEESEKMFETHTEGQEVDI